jgi:hypothetical protein
MPKNMHDFAERKLVPLQQGEATTVRGQTLQRQF